MGLPSVIDSALVKKLLFLALENVIRFEKYQSMKSGGEGWMGARKRRGLSEVTHSKIYNNLK